MNKSMRSFMMMSAVLLLLLSEVEARARTTRYVRRYVRYTRYSYGGSYVYYGGYWSPTTIIEDVVGICFLCCIFICLRICGCIKDEETTEVVVEEEVREEGYTPAPVGPTGNEVAYPDGYKPGDAPPSAPPMY